MKLIAALDEFSLQQRRRHRGDEGRLTMAALAALREFLVDYSGFEDTRDVSPRDLFTFLLDYYPSEEEVDVEVGLVLLETVADLALWLVERGERTLSPVVGARERLRMVLPRVLQAFDLLRAHTRRDDLAPEMALTDEDEEPRGAIGSGVNRVVRLDELTYASSETEYWTIQAVKGAALSLQTPQRESLGEVPLQPVQLPEGAAGLLAAGDIIHAEIAPGPSGWEMVEVFGIRPGGFL